MLCSTATSWELMCTTGKTFTPTPLDGRTASKLEEREQMTGLLACERTHALWLNRQIVNVPAAGV